MKFLLLMEPSSVAHFLFTVLKELDLEKEQIIYFEDILDDGDICYKSIKDVDTCQVINVKQVRPPGIGQLNIDYVVNQIDKKPGKEIFQILESDSGEDWFVICSYDYERLTPLPIIKKAARSYKVRLHLFFEIPYKFMGRKWTSRMKSFIDEFHTYASIFKFPMDNLVLNGYFEPTKKLNMNEAMYGAEDEYFKGIRTAIAEIRGCKPIGKQAKMVYDLENRVYYQPQDNYRHIMGGVLPPSEVGYNIVPGGIFSPSLSKNDEIIELPGSNGGGKDICNKLRELRIQFAKQYGLEYVPQECTHDGPCKGTCPACEQETKILMEAVARKLKPGVKNGQG